MNRFLKRALSLILIGIMAVNLCGCFAAKPSQQGQQGQQTQPAGQSGGSAMKGGSQDLMAGYTSSIAKSSELPDKASSEKAAALALRLFNACAEEDGNTLISPLSILYALSMTANGAENETLAEMESVLGMNVDELNEFCLRYANALEAVEGSKLALANSIWFTSDQRFTVNEAFLQKNADYYGADIYKAPFDDGTLYDINNWVKQKTDGMIPEALDEIPQEAVMYLINALAFDAEWETIYKKNDTASREFTKADGSKTAVEMMFSEESRYIGNENADGFIKYYKGRRYAFAALLPKEGTSPYELMASLTGEELLGMLSGAEDSSVSAGIPKFESGFNSELSSVLCGLGMPRAFDDSMAQLRGLGVSSAGNIFINRVIHKTFISVDERGTRAGAATIVEACDEACPLYEHTVILDRPFVYMLIDCETDLPFFIGVLADPA